MKGIALTINGVTTTAAIDRAGVGIMVNVLPEYNYITLGGYDPKSDMHITWLAKEITSNDTIEIAIVDTKEVSPFSEISHKEIIKKAQDIASDKETEERTKAHLLAKYLLLKKYLIDNKIISNEMP